MNNLDYLNQISADTRPVKKSSPSFLSSTIFKIILISVAALIFILILGALLSNINNKTKNLTESLKLHLDNLSATVAEYQPSVKSSSLRSYSSSLSAILTNTNRDLTAFMVEKYQYKDSKPTATLANQAAASAEELNNELFSAKINGILDRTYSHKMALEVSLLLSEESEIYQRTNSAPLKEILNSSYTSLQTLYENFSNFSETK